MRTSRDRANASPPQKASWHRRLTSRLVPRITLRLFFVLLTILCLFLGLWVHRAERQRAACAELKRLEWSYYLQSDGMRYDDKLPTWLTYVPKSLRDGEAIHYWLSIRDVFAGKDNLVEGLNATARIPSVGTLSFHFWDGPLHKDACKALSKATNLQALDLARTSIDDEGLTEIAKLTQLRSLDLDQTRIGNAGLHALAKLRRLESLSLNETNIDDDGMQFLAGLSHLRALELRKTNITSAGINRLSALTNLESLYLDGTKVDDEIESTIRRLPCLKVFSADDTQLSDASCASMLHQDSLEVVWLAYTSVKRKTIDSLSKLPNLTRIDLEGISLQPGDIRSLASAKKLERINLPGSVSIEDLLIFRQELSLHYVNGEKAEEFWLNLLSDKPSTQTFLRLSSHSLGKSGWEHIAKNTQITDLKIDRCDLSIDSLQRLTNLKNLADLEITDCQLTEASLEQIAKFTQLKSLQIQGGSFSDQGLSKLASLKRLETLELLSCEGISPSALSVFASLPNLQRLRVDTVVDGDPSPALSSILETSPGHWKNLELLRWGDLVVDQAALDVFLYRPIAANSEELEWHLNEPLDSRQLAIIAAASHLTTLSMDGPALLDSDWQHLGSLPNLMSIELFRCRAGENAFRWLAQLPRLADFKSYGYELPESSAQALSKSRSLSRIDCCGTAPTPETLRWLSQLPQLTDVDLSRCEVDSSTFEALVPGATQLETLNLSGNRITPETLRTLLTGLPALKSLDLIDCHLDRRAFEILAAHGGKLETLRMNGNDFRLEDILARLAAFPKLRLLQSNAANLEASSWQTSTISEQLRWLRWKLRLSSATPLSELAPFSEWRRYERLRLGSPLINDAFAIEILRCVRSHEQIDAGGGTIGADFLAELARMDQVIELDLSYTPITDSDLAHVAKLTRLRDLNLSGCKITDAGAALIAQNCWRLTKLDLSNTQITDQAIQDLAKLRFLEELDLNQLSITEEALQPLRALKHLKRITIDWDEYHWKPEE